MNLMCPGFSTRRDSIKVDPVSLSVYLYNKNFNVMESVVAVLRFWRVKVLKFIYLFNFFLTTETNEKNEICRL